MSAQSDVGSPPSGLFDRVPVERLLKRHRDYDQPFDVTINGVSLRIFPGVFCPTFTHTSSLLAAHVPVRERDRVLDLGCGSGFQGIMGALAGGNVTSVDRSEQAVLCTRYNARRLRLDDRIEVRRGDLYEPLPDERFDVVIANPPLLPARPADDLEAAVFDDGLEINRRLLRELPPHLADDGRLYLLTSDVGDRAGLLDMAAVCGEVGLAAVPVAKKCLPYETYQVWCVKRTAG